jgi:hypothetical protein
MPSSVEWTVWRTVSVFSVKSVPGDGGVSFLLAFFYDLVTILDHKLLSVVAHPVL